MKQDGGGGGLELFNGNTQTADHSVSNTQWERTITVENRMKNPHRCEMSVGITVRSPIEEFKAKSCSESCLHRNVL